MNKGRRILAGLLPAFLSSSAFADDFKYELGLTYSSLSIDGLSSQSPRPPDLPGFNVEFQEDIDQFGVSGSWYYGGVTASDGPRTRAAFLSRASFLTFDYWSLDGAQDSQVFADDDANITNPNDRFIENSDSVTLNGRYVWDSGWFVDAGLNRFDTKRRSSNLDPPGLGGFEVMTYRAGAGRYIGNNHTVGLAVDVLDFNISSGTSIEYTLNYAAVGSLGASWDYSADVNVTVGEDSLSDGSYEAELLLYPSRSFGFGAGIHDSFGSGASTFGDRINNYGTAYDLNVNWFPSEALGLEAVYRIIDEDDGPGTEFEVDAFNLSAVFRF